MLSRNQVRDATHAKGLSRADRLLICFGLSPEKPWTVNQLRKTASVVGLREAAKWNISEILSRQNGLIVRGQNGWELTSQGMARLQTFAPTATDGQTAGVLADLRAHTSKIANPVTVAFIEESIACLESGYLRAAVVLSWAGAVAVLHDNVVASHLTLFNLEGVRRHPKWRKINNINDLSRLKENDFLDLLEGASIVGKAVRDELQGCLRLRNGCAHPNNLKVGKARAVAHLESLINNVYSVF